MLELSDDQQRLITVLQRMIDLITDDDYYVETFLEPLDELLEQIAMDDGFGTERQSDPRGDGRDSPNWSMSMVQGVDE